MHSLRDRWQRGPVARYFAGLDRCDQATFIIVTALAFAIGVSFSVIVTRREPATPAPAHFAAPFASAFAVSTPAGTRS